MIARHIHFAQLAALADALIERSDGRKGDRPAYPTEVMVRILVLKRLYNLSDEQMEFQLLDHTSYQRFCLLQNSRNVPERNTIWRFGERIGVDGATALLHGVDAQLHSHGFMARGGQAIDATLVAAPVQRISKAERSELADGQQPEWSEAKGRQKDVDATHWACALLQPQEQALRCSSRLMVAGEWCSCRAMARTLLFCCLRLAIVTRSSGWSW